MLTHQQILLREILHNLKLEEDGCIDATTVSNECSVSSSQCWEMHEFLEYKFLENNKDDYTGSLLDTERPDNISVELWEEMRDMPPITEYRMYFQYLGIKFIWRKLELGEYCAQFVLPDSTHAQNFNMEFKEDKVINLSR